MIGEHNFIYINIIYKVIFSIYTYFIVLIIITLITKRKIFPPKLICLYLTFHLANLMFAVNKLCEKVTSRKDSTNFLFFFALKFNPVSFPKIIYSWPKLIKEP